jgi:hypothetical protein
VASRVWADPRGGASCADIDLGNSVPVTEAGSTTGPSESSASICPVGGGGGPETTFEFTAPVDGLYSIDVLEGTLFDTVLYVRDGDCSGVELACNDDVVPSIFQSRVDLFLTAGQTIVVFVDGYSAGDFGSFVLQVDVDRCPPAPAPGCRFPAVGQKALLVVKDQVDDAKDQILWKWLRGVVTPKADYGFPTIDEGYVLCVYEDNALVSSTRIEAGGICAGRECWQEKTTVFKFRDADLTRDGAFKVMLKEGLVDGTTRILFKGKGHFLEVPDLSTVNGTVDVRLMQTSGPFCWGATYSAPHLKNNGQTFKDKAD